MKQPELGKKISELRLAKGLTQTELAKKCSLSLRTIQRIETAEVMPRSYTIKIIFKTLEYNIYSSFGKFSYRIDRMTYLIRRTGSQFNLLMRDLFNLKTNTMKKLTILSLPILALLLSIGLSSFAGGKAKIRRSFEEASSNEMFMRCFNAGQMDSIESLYLDNAFAMPDNSPSLNGKDAIMERNRLLYSLGNRFTELRVESKILDGSLAFERGVWTMAVGPQQILYSGTYITQWHYINGEWKIETEMSKTDLPLNTN